jgi:uncharacterized membrane protein YfcA
MTSDSLVVPIIVFSAAAFIGNFGVAITGFGMAIFFLFVYTIADFATLMECTRCDIRDAVFYQTLALGSAIPFLIYQARSVIKEHWSKELLAAFIPATIIGTPIGNFLQDHLPSDILRIIVGAVVTGILCYDLSKSIPSSDWYQRCCRHEKGTLAAIPGNDAEEGDSFDNQEKKYRDSEQNDDVDRDRNNDESPVDPIEKCDDIESNETKTDVSPKDSTKDTLPTGWRLRIWGFVLGFLSGFLGGLIGIRGPPLMVFFLVFPYPKSVVRGNAVLILLVNVLIRCVYYVVEDLTGVRKVSWFESSYLYLYICVIFFGLLGVPAGNYVASKLNQQQFKLVIAFMLIMSGLSNLIKGSISLANT